MATQTVEELLEIQPESVQGKAVLVTGGTTGIGRAIAMLLVARGARVLIFGREEGPLNDALREIKGVGGGEIHGLTADTTKREDVERVFREVDTRLEGLDVLVNNAALGAGSVLDSDYDEWVSVVHTNLIGYMSFCKAAVERMRGKGGHIVNIGSMSAKVREEGSDVYVATKSGIEGFTDSLAKLANKEGIRVTLIEPGLVGTEMTTDQVPKEQQPEKEEQMEMMKAGDLASCVYYALVQPKRVSVALVQIRPTMQII